MSEAFCSAGGVDSWFMQQFPPTSRIYIPGIAVVHLAHGHFASNWNGLDKGRHCWKQLGVFTAGRGLILFTEPPKGRIRIRLTDTFYGDQAELELESIARAPGPEVLAFDGRGGLSFKGRNIGRHHIHVAYFG